MADATRIGMPGQRQRVCVSLRSGNLEGLRGLLRYASPTEIAELRLDALPAAERDDAQALALLLAEAPCPALVTCRPVAGLPESRREQLLQRALSAGAWAVDVELESAFAAGFVERHAPRTVVSHHWPVPRPEDIEEVADRAARLRPAIVKLVAPAGAGCDAEDLLARGRRLRRGGQPAATFCLGEEGRASRLVDFASGGELLYVAGDGGAPTAAGQWRAAWVRGDLRPQGWMPGAARYGLIGDPLQHSLSPAIFNLAFVADGSGRAYVPIPGPSVETALSLAAGAGFHGLSVTMPFKEQVLAHCEVDEMAARIGAVNTLTRKQGRWLGSNTDGPAVAEVVGRYASLRGARVLVLGAGGAGRAAAAALAAAGAQVMVANRTPERAARLATAIAAEAVEWTRAASVAADVVVNATSVGLGSTSAPELPRRRWHGDEIAVDMVYRPLETDWLRRARECGGTAIPGLEVFLAQASAQYRLWTDEEPPLASWRQECLARLTGTTEE